MQAKRICRMPTKALAILLTLVLRAAAIGDEIWDGSNETNAINMTLPSFHGIHSMAWEESQNCSMIMPLRLRQFGSWAEYLHWRAQISPTCASNQPIHPCVWTEDHWTCLPKIVVIGAMKAGTTALRNILGASGLFTTKTRMKNDNSTMFLEPHFWDSNFMQRKGHELSNTQVMYEWTKAVGAFPDEVQWSDLADENGLAKRLSMDVTPNYSRFLVAQDIQRILQINPDVHFLLLARDPADAIISATDMQICSGPGLGMTGPEKPACGVVGCGFSPTQLFPPPEKAEDVGRCSPERIPCSVFQGQLNALLSRYDSQEFAQMIGKFEKQNGNQGYGHMFRWRYPWLLKQQWLPWVPQDKLHVMRSELLWEEPQLALDTLSDLLRLNFKIPFTSVETKPIRQLQCKCKESDDNRKAFHDIVERCQLREGISCAHFHSNRQMQEIMNSRFPYGLPSGSSQPDWNRGLTPEDCQQLGFGVDINYHTLLHSAKDILYKGELGGYAEISTVRTVEPEEDEL